MPSSSRRNPSRHSKPPLSSGPASTSPFVPASAMPAIHHPQGAKDKPSDVMRSLIQRHLVSTLARHTGSATPRDWWVATVLALRDTIHERMIETQAVHNAQNVRRIYYFSLEYLMGRLFGSNLIATGLFEHAKTALASLGQDFDLIRESEVDMGLGNGGLGRLAACFMDSLATLDYPALGYGIYYEFGLFKQEFVHGHQIEHPDNWMKFGDPWEVVRPEYAQEVRLYGRVENVFDDRGNYRPRWVDTKTILGVPHDIPIAGYGTKTVNLLRLWASKATEDFDLAAFNSGGYVEAVREKAVGETVSKVLYPNDKSEAGKELRLVQQYFFVACSLRDILRRHFRQPGNSWDNFADKVAVQLNDTHPAISIVELMRILLDEHHVGWDTAWGIVTKTFAYTNHTLLPEALEKWGVGLFERVLPRHLQIIYDINARLMQVIEAHWPGDDEKKRICSIIEENARLVTDATDAATAAMPFSARLARCAPCSAGLASSDIVACMTLSGIYFSVLAARATADGNRSRSLSAMICSSLGENPKDSFAFSEAFRSAIESLKPISIRAPTALITPKFASVCPLYRRFRSGARFRRVFCFA